MKMKINMKTDKLNIITQKMNMITIKNNGKDNSNNIIKEKRFDYTLFYKKYKTYLPNNLLPSTNFLSWLIGLSEGEGSFIVNKRGDLAFIITQNTSDINILYYIQEILGFGKVIPQSAKTSRYVTQSKREIEIIISLFNANTLLPTKKKRLYLFIKGFNDWVTKGSIRLEPVTFIDNNLLPRLDNSWLCGFTDGEGCFSCSIRVDAKRYSINFSIAQKGEINLPILNILPYLFKGGRVTNHSVKDVYEYRINGVKFCSNVFSYFDEFNLLTKKSLSYVLWKETYKDLVSKHHLDESKILVMSERAKMINKSNII